MVAEALPLSVSLVPELDVTDLDSSLAFYVRLIGFEVVFEGRRERFAYLVVDALSGAEGPGWRFRTAPLAHPEERCDAKMPIPAERGGASPTRWLMRVRVRR